MRLLDRLKTHRPRREALAVLRYIGPGLLVTVGFIDPGNWAANIAAGSRFGYSLLWVITLSTVMLVPGLPLWVGALSEIIQSRRWNMNDDKVIRRQLKFEFADTLLSMSVGWAINSALIIVAAATFFGRDGRRVDLRRDIRRILRHQGPPLEDRGRGDAGGRGPRCIHRRESLQGAAPVPDAPQHPASDHDRSGGCDRAQYAAAGERPRPPELRLAEYYPGSPELAEKPFD